MNTPNRPQKKRKPKAKIDKDYKERVYKEWIQRRNALDLGRPITLGARAAADSETSEVKYSQISNISGTKSQNLTVSRLVLQLSLCNMLNPGVKLRMKM